MHWRRKWQPTPVLLPGKSNGRRSLAGYSPWGCEESDATEQATQQQQRQLSAATELSLSAPAVRRGGQAPGTCPFPGDCSGHDVFQAPARWQMQGQAIPCAIQNWTAALQGRPLSFLCSLSSVFSWVTDLPKVTELIRGRFRIKPQEVWGLILCSWASPDGLIGEWFCSKIINRTQKVNRQFQFLLILHSQPSVPLLCFKYEPNLAKNHKIGMWVWRWLHRKMKGCVTRVKGGTNEG